jgi:hypothetical protein
MNNHKNIMSFEAFQYYAVSGKNLQERPCYFFILLVLPIHGLGVSHYRAGSWGICR